MLKQRLHVEVVYFEVVFQHVPKDVQSKPALKAGKAEALQSPVTRAVL